MRPILRWVPAVLLLVVLASAVAMADDCPAGTVQIGEQREETATAIIVHPVCQAPAAVAGSGANCDAEANGPAVAPMPTAGDIIACHDAEIAAVQARIEATDAALRSLIAAARLDNEQRLEWEKESAQASDDAQKLSLNLTLDLIGAHIDHEQEAGNIVRGQALQNIASGAGAERAAARASQHNYYGLLLDRRDELTRIGHEVKIAQNLNEAREKIDMLEGRKEMQSTPELIYDAFTKIPAVEKLAGPSKDLVDAAYVVAQQASSMVRLNALQGNSDKYLQASASLQTLLKKLVEKKQELLSTQPNTPGQHCRTPASR